MATDEPLVKKAKIDEDSIGLERRTKDGSLEEGGFLSNIALFQPLPTELGINKVDMIDHRPVNTISYQSVVEFSIPSQGMTYYDLSKSLLYIRAKIVKADGTSLSDIDPVTWCNAPLHSLFRQVELSLQEVVVTNGVNTNYPYKAMFDVLTNFEQNTKETQLQSILYNKDTKGAMDNNDPIDVTNTALKWRFGFTKGSKLVDMIGPLFLDLCSQERLLLNNVRIRIKLFPAPDAFVLMAPKRGEYKTVIQDIIFKVAAVTVSPKVVLAHDEALKRSPAQYYIKRSEIKSFAIASGSNMWACDDVFCSRIPTKIIVAFVDSDAYLGTELKNPFNFQNMGLNYLNFEVDGVSYPKAPFQPNYEQHQYMESYISLFTSNGTLNTNDSNYIDRFDFPLGYALYCIPINTYRSDDFINPPKYGCTRITAQFAKPLPNAITMLCYGVYDDIIEIDRSRNVKFKSLSFPAMAMSKR